MIACWRRPGIANAAATPVTDVLARATLGVPFYRDIGAAEIGRVAEIVLAAADGSLRPQHAGDAA